MTAQEALDKLAILLSHYGYTEPMEEFKVLQNLIDKYKDIEEIIKEE